MAPDEGARVLMRLGRRALHQAPAAVPACVSASYMQPVLVSERDDLCKDGYSWRLAGLEREVSCCLDVASACVLLGWTVGTTPVRRLSRIERTIVTEVIRQLLSGASDHHQICEEQSPLHTDARQIWLCKLRLSAASPTTVTLQLVATPDAPVVLGRACRRSLGSVLLPLRAAIPGVSCTFGALRALRPGALLPLHRSHTELAAALYAGRRYIAAAQLGAAHGTRALKLLSLAAGGRA
jgi:hypothetical protein